MPLVDYDFAGGAARITLADAELGNPVHTDSVAELAEAVRRAHADRAKVIVLAACGRFFSVGGDLAAFGASPDLPAYIDGLAEALHAVVAELVRSDAIVVSVIQGHAAGAGFPLAAAADVVVAAQTARFSLGYTKVGLSVDGGTSMLAHSLGLHRALRLALLNDALTAEQAYAAGLVARVVPDGELAATAEAVVAQLLCGPREGQAATKRLLRGTVESDPEGLMKRETEAIRDNAGRPDGREGIAAFLEKRPAVFGG